MTNPQQQELRRRVANIFARVRCGSLNPALGDDDDVPGGLDDSDWIGADAAISVCADVMAEIADRQANAAKAGISDSRYDVGKLNAASHIACSIRSLAGEG